MEKIKILLIDDEEDFRYTVKNGLELLGNFEVTTADDGKRGIALAKKLKPHLILLDMKMPHMDGMKVLELLKKDKHTIEIPVAVLTTVNNEAFKVRAAQLYDEQYITKNIDITQLKAKIEEILQRLRVI